jgi:hypothetical protein
MPSKDNAGLFEIIGQLNTRLVKSIAFLVFLRAILALVHQLPLPQSLWDLFAPVFSIPFLSFLIQLLINIRYTSPLEILLDSAIFVILFVLTLYLVIPVVFPVQSWRDRWKARSFLIGATHLKLPHPVIRVSEGKFEIRGVKPEQARGPGIVLCDNVTAVALEKKNTFTRVLGPGFHFIDIDEQVLAAIDLRPQSMRRKVTVSTREGIEVEIDLSVTIEIQHGKESPSGEPHYPFDPEAVRRAVYAEHVHISETTRPHAPRSAADWCETIVAVCKDHLRHIVAGYTLDQLFAVDNPDLIPRQVISEQLTRIARAEVGRYGANLLNASVSRIHPPPSVIKQRVTNWLADWQRREHTLKALGEARQMELKESARILAQAEMLQRLEQILAPHPENLSPDILSLRLLEAFERMMLEPGTAAQLDKETFDFLQRLIELLKPPEGAP